MTGTGTMNRWIRKYKEIGSIESCKRIKYRAGKFSDEALREHVLTNPSSTLEEIALFFCKASVCFFSNEISWNKREKIISSIKKEIRKKMNSAK